MSTNEMAWGELRAAVHAQAPDYDTVHRVLGQLAAQPPQFEQALAYALARLPDAPPGPSSLSHVIEVQPWYLERVLKLAGQAFQGDGYDEGEFSDLERLHPGCPTLRMLEIHRGDVSLSGESFEFGVLILPRPWLLQRALPRVPTAWKTTYVSRLVPADALRMPPEGQPFPDELYDLQDFWEWLLPDATLTGGHMLETDEPRVWELDSLLEVVLEPLSAYTHLARGPWEPQRRMNDVRSTPTGWFSHEPGESIDSELSTDLECAIEANRALFEPLLDLVRRVERDFELAEMWSLWGSACDQPPLTGSRTLVRACDERLMVFWAVMDRYWG